MAFLGIFICSTCYNQMWFSLVWVIIKKCEMWWHHPFEVWVVCVFPPHVTSQWNGAEQIRLRDPIRSSLGPTLKRACRAALLISLITGRNASCGVQSGAQLTVLMEKFPRGISMINEDLSDVCLVISLGLTGVSGTLRKLLVTSYVFNVFFLYN